MINIFQNKKNELFIRTFLFVFLFILFTSSINPESNEKKLNKYTAINLATGNINKITMIIQDSLGRKTGYDYSNDKYNPEEIPGSVCFIDGISDLESGAPPEEYSELIQINQASAGVYKIIIKGKQTGSFEINLMAVAYDNSFLQFSIEEPYLLKNGCIFKGEIGKDEVKYFKLVYDPTPGSITEIKEIVE